MDKKKLIDDLKTLLETKNIKKSVAEKEIGMPLNSLSNFLSGKKELPDKWVDFIASYIQKYTPILDDGKEQEAVKSNERTKMVVDKEGFKEKPISTVLRETM